MIIDTHGHYDDEQFDVDREMLLTNLKERGLKAIVEAIPLTSIVLETDCPYLAPEPNRGKRNESAYIQYVAEEIARLKGISVEEVLTQTEMNAKQVYQLRAVS